MTEQQQQQQEKGEEEEEEEQQQNENESNDAEAVSEIAAEAAGADGVGSPLAEGNSITLELIAGFEAKDGGDEEEGGDEEKNSKEDLFVNVGLQRWEVERSRWLSSASLDETHPTNKSVQQQQRHAIELDVDEVIDCVFSNRWRQTAQQLPSGGRGGRGFHQKIDDGSFPCPVPLPQMVDILVDLWEAEGLDM